MRDTPEGDAFAAMMRHGKTAVPATITVEVVKGCKNPECVCGGKPAVRMRLDEWSADCRDRKSLQELIDAMQYACDFVWGEDNAHKKKPAPPR